MTVSLGAIRWDAWYSNTPGQAAWWEQQTLAAPEWQHRLPPHAVNIRSNAVDFDVSQARMDQEIAWANQAKIYWAFLMYTTGLAGGGTFGQTMRGGLDLYMASAAKGGLKWCMIQQPAYMGVPGNFTAEIATIAALMAGADYKRVLTNRPLLYLYTPSGNLGGSWGVNYAAFALAITALRNACIALGTGDPYIVLLSVWSGPEAVRAAVGADAVSVYSLGLGTGDLGKTYTGLAAYSQGYWTSGLLPAAAMVPNITVGWDRRPRNERPPPWEPDYLPRMGSTGWAVQPTPAELAAHINAGKAFMAANAAKCPSETMLAYAWNEFSEGGWICPARSEVGAAGNARLDAIAATLP